MNEVPKKSWADTKINDDFICIRTASGYRSASPDYRGRQDFLPPNADDEVIGHTLIDALAQSKFLDPMKNNDFFDSESVAQRYAEWVRAVMERYGYKTKRAMFKNMKSCRVECHNNVIMVKPSNHVKLEAWGREKSDGIEDVVISANSSPREIGAALRLAFERCT